MMTKILLEVNREALVRAYCEFRSPCVNWAGVIIEQQGNLIVALARHSKDDLVFTPHDVVNWATSKFMEKAMMEMF